MTTRVTEGARRVRHVYWLDSYSTNSTWLGKYCKVKTSFAVLTIAAFAEREVIDSYRVTFFSYNVMILAIIKLLFADDT